MSSAAILIDPGTGQGYPNWPLDYNPSPQEWAALFASKADAAPDGSVLGVVADAFRQAGDGADDAPCIARAIAFCQASATCRRVLLQPRTYALRSPISFNGGPGFELVGAGFSEAPLASGTWFSISDASFNPITLIGIEGIEISGIAVAQAHPTNFAAGWAPNVYPPVFTFNTCNHLRIQNMFGCGVYVLFSFVICPRLVLRDIYGQFFDCCYIIDQTYDRVFIDNIHAWPFWSMNDYVTAFTLQNCDVNYLLRADTPYLGQLFGYGVRSVLRFSQSAGGGTAGTPGGFATAGTFISINADTCEHAVWVDSTVQLTENLGENGVWATIGNITCGCGTAPIGGFSRANACPVLVDGVANLRLTELTANVLPYCAVKMTGTGTPSQVTIARSVLEFSYADPVNRCVFFMGQATGGWPGDQTGLKHIGRVSDVNPGNRGTPLKNPGSSGTVYVMVETAS